MIRNVPQKLVQIQRLTPRLHGVPVQWISTNNSDVKTAPQATKF
jgi:hypothetical protein